MCVCVCVCAHNCTLNYDIDQSLDFSDQLWHLIDQTKFNQAIYKRAQVSNIIVNGILKYVHIFKIHFNILISVCECKYVYVRMCVLVSIPLCYGLCVSVYVYACICVCVVCIPLK